MASTQKIVGDQALTALVSDIKGTFATRYTKDEVNELFAESLPTKKASGSIATFNTQLGFPLKSCKANIVASQPSGTPTPSTPLPINGYTEANITRCGVNLWDENLAYGNIDNTGADSGSDNKYIRTADYIRVKPNTNYCFYFKDNNNFNQMYVIQYDSAKGFISRGSIQGGLSTNEYYATFTTSATTEYIRCFVYDSSPLDLDSAKISINFPATDTTYHAYNGTTVTIAFGQTVYGGVLDVTRGKFHVTWGDVDLASITWGYTGNFFYAYLNNYKDNAGGSTIEMPHALCSTYTVGAIKNVYDGVDKTISLGTELNYSGRIILKDTAYTDAPTFQQNVTGKLAYELATPFDIDLTPVQIRALVGVNNVFADCGNVEVDFNDVNDYTEISGTLAAGATSITLTSGQITADSTIEVFTDVYGVNPTDITVATGSVTLTFDAQASDLGVKVRVT